MKFRELIIAFLIIFIAGCGDNKEEQNLKEIEIIEIEPELTQNLNAPFSIELLSGETFGMIRKENGYDMGSGDHATLFVYWATWCPPCIIEILPLNNLSKNFGKDLKIIAVLVNDPISDEELATFIEERGIIYDVTRDSETLIKTMGGLKGIPYMVLYDKNGMYNRHYFGVIAEEMLQKDIERVIK